MVNGARWSKETNFFKNKHQGGPKCDRDLLFYPASLYPLRKPVSEAPVIGDFSVMHLACPCCPRLFQRISPEVKLIALLRNPVARAVSHYHQHQQLNISFPNVPKNVSFAEFAAPQIQRARSCLAAAASGAIAAAPHLQVPLQAGSGSNGTDAAAPTRSGATGSNGTDGAAPTSGGGGDAALGRRERQSAHLESSCLDDASVFLIGWSAYAPQLLNWLAHFNRSQLLVAATEDLEADPLGVLRRIEAFLGLPAHDYPAELLVQAFNTQAVRGHGRGVDRERMLNGSSAHVRSSEDDVSELEEFLAPFTARLKDMAAAGLIAKLPEEFYSY